jgi:polypyrimidine tract-binding protein 2
MKFFIPYRATVTEDEIKEAFSDNGFEVKAFKFFP